MATVPLSLSPDWISRCITHLFTSFVWEHNFTGKPHSQYRELETLIHSSPCLQNAALALSSLDLEKNKRVVDKTIPKTALKYYSAAVTLLRSELGHPNTNGHNQDDLLWSTLLLSIFELMCDTTGDGFLFHFVQGTASLLQAQGPDYCLQSSHRSFFRLARMFEIGRAVVFWDGTFLQEPQWQDAIRAVSESDGLANPSGTFEELLTLLAEVITLNHNTKALALTVTPVSLQPQHVEQLHNAANQGLELERTLESWHASLISRSSSTASQTHPDESQLLLALIYYHTTSMNIISTFSNHLHFAYLALSVPIHTPSQTQSHVNAVLDLVNRAVQRTTLAGPLLLWPLRAAGSRSVTKEQLGKVVELLREIARKGFVVARSFEESLRRQWAIRGLM